MRLSESRIKSGLLHEDQFVRDLVLAYYANAHSTDPSILPMAIQAIEAFGFKASFQEPDALQDLVQTDDTFAWFVRQLDDSAAATHPASVLTSISWILAAASAGMLKRRRSEFIDLPRLDPEARNAVVVRTRLLKTAPEACWQQLTDFSASAAANTNISEQQLDQLGYVLEAIARHPEFGERIRETLATHPPTDDLSRAYMDLFATRIAGLMRLEDTTSALIERLGSPYDWTRDEASTALIRIGTDAVVKAMWNAYVTAPDVVRDGIAWTLGCIHSDLAAEACLQLFQIEEAKEVKEELGLAVLAQLDVDGITSVRQYLMAGGKDAAQSPLQLEFLAVCSLMQAELPELAAWREDARKQVQLREQFESPEFLVTDNYTQQLYEVQTAKQIRPAERAAPKRRGEAVRSAGPRIGRNAPCPCQSGKKFKDCCLPLRKVR